MASDVVKHEDYLNYKNNVKNSRIEKFLGKIKTILGFDESEPVEFELIEDNEFDAESLNQRLIVKVKSSSEKFKEEFEKHGPHFIYVNI